MTTAITTSATVKCVHGGKITLSNPGPAKLVVGGEPVAVAAGVSSWIIAAAPADPQGCPATAPNGNPSPCLTVAPPTAGTATKLTVGGSPVLLRSLKAVAAGSLSTAPPPPILATVSGVTSSKLSAV